MYYTYVYLIDMIVLDIEYNHVSLYCSDIILLFLFELFLYTHSGKQMILINLTGAIVP